MKLIKNILHTVVIEAHTVSDSWSNFTKIFTQKKLHEKLRNIRWKVLKYYQVYFPITFGHRLK
jgi:hypothetical protein